jgi:hypothetical protein
MGSKSILYKSEGNLKRKSIFNQRREKAGSEMALPFFVDL